MKRVKSSWVVLAAGILVMVIIQSCGNNDTVIGSITNQQTSQNPKSNVQLTRVVTLTNEIKMLKQVKHAYGNKTIKYRGKNTTKSSKALRFGKNGINTINYQQGKIFYYSNGSKIIDIPVTNKSQKKAKVKDQYRSANLIISVEDNIFRKVYLSALTTTKKFRRKIKHAKSNNKLKNKGVNFSGTVKLYVLKNKKIEDFHSFSYKNGRIGATLNSNSKMHTNRLIKGKNIAGNPTSISASASCIFCAETWHSIKNYAVDTWNCYTTKQILLDEISVRLSQAGCASATVTNIAVSYSSGGTLTAWMVGMNAAACTSYGISIYNLMHDKNNVDSC